jgi:hypothetical protein
MSIEQERPLALAPSPLDELQSKVERSNLVCYYFPLQGDSPVPRGGSAAARQRAPLARMQIRRLPTVQLDLPLVVTIGTHRRSSPLFADRPLCSRCVSGFCSFWQSPVPAAVKHISTTTKTSKAAGTHRTIRTFSTELFYFCSGS